MGGWYWIGVATGLGVALGALAAGGVPRWPIAAVVGAAAGAGLAIALFGWPEAVGAGVGGLLGGGGSAVVVAGALRRGGTRGGLAAFGAVGGVVAAAIAFVPVAGFLMAAVAPGLALRVRSKAPDRHAGLRILARD